MCTLPTEWVAIHVKIFINPGAIVIMSHRLLIASGGHGSKAHLKTRHGMTPNTSTSVNSSGAFRYLIGLWESGPAQSIDRCCWGPDGRKLIGVPCGHRNDFSFPR